MKFLIREKLSPHKYKTPEGYLICQDAILARTGKQSYRKNELFADAEDGDTEIDVDRPYDEVFAPETLASFENKPVTVEHPDEDVNSENYKSYSVGFARDIRQAKTEDGEDVIIGNLVIQDADTIEEILNGEHCELSCGYDCDIKDDKNGYRQTHIRGNHIALCEKGRAGIAKIVDSVKDGLNINELKIFANAIYEAKNKNEIENKIYEINTYDQRLFKKLKVEFDKTNDLFTLKNNLSKILTGGVQDSVKDKESSKVRQYIEILEGRIAKKEGYRLRPNMILLGEHKTQFPISTQVYQRLVELGYDKNTLDDSIKDEGMKTVRITSNDVPPSQERYIESIFNHWNCKYKETSRFPSSERPGKDFIAYEVTGKESNIKGLLQNLNITWKDSVKDEQSQFDAYELRDRFGRDYDDEISKQFPNVKVKEFARFGSVTLTGPKSDLDKISKMIKFEDSVKDNDRDIVYRGIKIHFFTTPDKQQIYEVQYNNNRADWPEYYHLENAKRYIDLFLEKGEKVANTSWIDDSVKDSEYEWNGMWINGTLKEFNPSDFIARVQKRREALHSNRITVKTENRVVVYTIFCFPRTDTNIVIDIVKCIFTRAGNDLDDIRSYKFNEDQQDALRKRCGSWDEAIKALEDFKRNVHDSVKDYIALRGGDKIYLFGIYENAKRKADQLKLKVYKKGITSNGCNYCFWNKTGDSNGFTQVICYYLIKNGKFATSYSEEEIEKLTHADNSGVIYWSSEFDDIKQMRSKTQDSVRDANRPPIKIPAGTTLYFINTKPIGSAAPLIEGKKELKFNKDMSFVSVSLLEDYADGVLSAQYKSHPKTLWRVYNSDWEDYQVKDSKKVFSRVINGKTVYVEAKDIKDAVKKFKDWQKLNIRNYSYPQFREIFTFDGELDFNWNDIFSRISDAGYEYDAAKKLADELFAKYKGGEKLIKALYETLKKGVKDSKKDALGHYFRLDKKKNDYDEFVVKEYVNGKFREEGSYHTDDWEDAVGTIKSIAKSMKMNIRQQGSSFIADSKKKVTDRDSEIILKLSKPKNNFQEKAKKCGVYLIPHGSQTEVVVSGPSKGVDRFLEYTGNGKYDDYAINTGSDMVINELKENARKYWNEKIRKAKEQLKNYTSSDVKKRAYAPEIQRLEKLIDAYNKKLQEKLNNWDTMRSWE